MHLISETQAIFLCVNFDVCGRNFFENNFIVNSTLHFVKMTSFILINKGCLVPEHQMRVLVVQKGNQNLKINLCNLSLYREESAQNNDYTKYLSVIFFFFL